MDHMINLRNLNASGDEKDNLIGLNLVELNVSYNSKIKK